MTLWQDVEGCGPATVSQPIANKWFMVDIESKDIYQPSSIALLSASEPITLGWDFLIEKITFQL